SSGALDGVSEAPSAAVSGIGHSEAKSSKVRFAWVCFVLLESVRLVPVRVGHSEAKSPLLEFATLCLPLLEFVRFRRSSADRRPPFRPAARRFADSSSDTCDKPPETPREPAARYSRALWNTHPSANGRPAYSSAHSAHSPSRPTSCHRPCLTSSAAYRCAFSRSYTSAAG